MLVSIGVLSAMLKFPNSVLFDPFHFDWHISQVFGEPNISIYASQSETAYAPVSHH